MQDIADNGYDVNDFKIMTGMRAIVMMRSMMECLST